MYEFLYDTVPLSLLPYFPSSVTAGYGKGDAFYFAAASLPTFPLCVCLYDDTYLYFSVKLTQYSWGKIWSIIVGYFSVRFYFLIFC